MKLTFTLVSEKIRQAVMARVRAAPVGWRVTIDEGKHTDEQRARFHAGLDYFAARAEHFGKSLTVKTWKAVFLHELGREQGYEVQLVPSLDGTEIVAVGRSTADLSATDYSGMIDILYREAALQGVHIPEPRLDPDWKPRQGRKAKRAGMIGVSPEVLAVETERGPA